MSITVEELLKGNINEKYNDKIFWYASKVIIKEKSIDIFIKNNNLVTFDDIDLKYKKISELQKKEVDKNILKNVLISSGSFLFINNKLVVTQRDSSTKYDPEHWTTPAGRCDRTILETAIKETIEEIEITNDNKLLLPSISKINVTNINNIEFYKISFYDKCFPLKTYIVRLYLEDKLIENCNSWMYYSEKVNTIEFRIPIFTKMDESKLNFTNPEFGTDTKLKSIEELKKLKTVPALTHLIKEIGKWR